MVDNNITIINNNITQYVFPIKYNPNLNSQQVSENMNVCLRT